MPLLREVEGLNRVIYQERVEGCSGRSRPISALGHLSILQGVGFLGKSEGKI